MKSKEKILIKLQNLKIVISFFFLSALLVSCKKNATQLSLRNGEAICAIWKRQYVEYIYNDKRHEKLAKQFQPRIERDYYINMFPDGKGSIIYRTEIDTFNWHNKENGSNVSNIVNVSYRLPSEIDLLEIDGDTTLRFTTDNGHTEMYFAKVGNLTKDIKEDPVHPDNNYWRIRANEHISDQEIKLKVESYLEHYRLLFKAGLDEEINRRFSNKHTLGVLRIYKSGIGIVKKENIDEDWKSYFYDLSEANKAYDKLKQIIGGKVIRIKETDNWVEDNYNILDSLVLKIERDQNK